MFRKPLFLLLICILVRDVLPAQDLVFREERFDFGQIKEEGPIMSHSFRVAWKGKSKIEKMDIALPCGCVDAKIFGLPFEPGDSGWVKVLFDPASRPGPFDFNVSFLDGEQSVGKVTIKGVVLSKELEARELYPFESGSFRIKANHLLFGKLKNTRIDTLTTLIFNQGSSVVKIDPKTSRVPKHIRIIPAANMVLPGTEISLMVIYDANARKSFGPATDTIWLMTNDSREAKKRILVTADVRQDFSGLSPGSPQPTLVMEESELNFGEIQGGESKSAEIVIHNSGKADLQIQSIFCRSDWVKIPALPPPVPPGGECHLEVSVRCGDRKGPWDKFLFILSNDPEHAENKVILKAGFVPGK